MRNTTKRIIAIISLMIVNGSVVIPFLRNRGFDNWWGVGVSFVVLFMGISVVSKVFPEPTRLENEQEIANLMSQIIELADERDKKILPIIYKYQGQLLPGSKQNRSIERQMLLEMERVLDASDYSLSTNGRSLLTKVRYEAVGVGAYW